MGRGFKRRKPLHRLRPAAVGAEAEADGGVGAAANAPNTADGRRRNTDVVADIHFNSAAFLILRMAKRARAKARPTLMRTRTPTSLPVVLRQMALNSNCHLTSLPPSLTALELMAPPLVGTVPLQARGFLRSAPVLTRSLPARQVTPRMGRTTSWHLLSSTPQTVSRTLAARLPQPHQLTIVSVLLPWFPTPQEQSLILHYCANAADLMIAIPQGINPLLAINLPLALAAPRGTNLAADALRITLLGIGAVHQAFLLARSGVSTTQTTATFQYASNLRDMGKELVRRATLPEGGGIASDAALSAGTSLATIDIFFGGSGWQENFALAKRMVAARGGPARMLKDSTPTHLSDGVTATPSRLILEILAIYETFGCLTMGEEPELISDRDSWWFESSGSTFEEHSVETQFGMSRVMVHLFSRTARLLARAAKTGTGFLPEGSPTNKLSADSVLHVDSSGSGLLPASVMPYVYVPSEDSNEPAGLASEAARLSRDIDMWIESLAFSSVEHERVQVGNRAYAHAMKILLLRMVYGRSRDDSSVQAAAQEVLQHCSISTAALGMSIDLMWPAVIAGCCVEGSARQWLLTLLEGFKSQCCFDVDTASRIIQEVWRRVDAGEPRADWKPVCDDFGLQVLLC